jgi:hypothetical protein
MRPAPVRMQAKDKGVAVARAIVERLGGRLSSELGLDLDSRPQDVERWLLVASLFGHPISSSTVVRTVQSLSEGGVRTPADAGHRSWDELVQLLDAGGYVRYDFRTATRLQDLARAVSEQLGGSVGDLRSASREDLEAALGRLPGFGPVTSRIFLRELRGVWPGARPTLDSRALWAAGHLGLAPARERGALRRLSALAARAGVDLRDLEAGLIRLQLQHRRGRECPGGGGCVVLATSQPAGRNPEKETKSEATRAS